MAKLTRLTTLLCAPMAGSALLFAAYPHSLMLGGAFLVSLCVLSAFAIDMLTFGLVSAARSFIVSRSTPMKKPAGI